MVLISSISTRELSPIGEAAYYVGIEYETQVVLKAYLDLELGLP